MFCFPGWNVIVLTIQLNQSIVIISAVIHTLILFTDKYTSVPYTFNEACGLHVFLFSSYSLFLSVLAECTHLILVCWCFLPSLTSPSLFPTIGSKTLDVLQSEDLATLIMSSSSSSSSVTLGSARPAFIVLFLRLGTLCLVLCDLTPPYLAQYAPFGHTSATTSPITCRSSLILCNLYLFTPYLDCSSLLTLVIPMTCIIDPHSVTYISKNLQAPKDSPHFAPKSDLNC